MNKSKLKSYAPAARREFIQAVTDRAHFYGLSENKNETQPVEEKGDVAIIGGRAFPRKIAAQRKNLEQRLEREGFAQVMEAVAYTWFNRFLALRYMEIHGYLEHGFRVLSNPSGSTIPEILEQAAQVQLPGLDHKKVVELKLDGSRDVELYRMILVAQCNALNTAMPFLFERIDDETELLLPDNLLHSDSLIRKLVTEIGEEDWQQVEIIGWLYQFYISEKKDQVIGKVVKPEDIPAATQLFTPNWIVKYMVQNSLGRMWLATYPNSSLKGKMEYYIEPAEQTDEVNTQLAAITPKELNPETITLLDPASGSGHILVEAYDLFKEIYLERGYRSRDIPRLILEKNLFGLDIDDRAAQMSGFALFMKARADDRRILKENTPRLNVMAIQSTEGIDVESIANALLKEKTFSIVEGPSTLFPETIAQPVLSTTQKSGISKNDIKDLLELFKQGKNFGSLIQIPEKIAGKLKAIANIVESNINSLDIFTQKAANTLLPLVRQAMILAGKYDCVVANPPYMGSKGMNSIIKDFAKVNFPDSKADIFAMFIERGVSMAKTNGSVALVTMQSWMFLSSYETLRNKFLQNNTLFCLAHFPYENRMPTAMGINFGISVFVLGRSHLDDYKAHFCCGRHYDLNEDGKPVVFPPANERLRYLGSNIFEHIPGKPISYWINPGLRRVFDNGTTLESKYPPKTGMTTGDDARFLRQWFEVSAQMLDTICESSIAVINSTKKWFPYNKGGVGDRWYGHCNFVVNWKNDGAEIKDWVVNNPNDPNTTSWSRRIFNHDIFFKPGLTWTLLNSRTFNVRFLPVGNILNVNGPTISIPENDQACYVLGFLNSKVAAALVQVINPTAANNPGDIGKLPLLLTNVEEVSQGAHQAITICKAAWNESETSFDFQKFPFVFVSSSSSLSAAYEKWRLVVSKRIEDIKALEEKNNRVFINAYGLQEEILPEISEDQITLARADGESDVKRLISYAVGCMMGRYRIDRPGLIYAHSGNVDFWNIYNGNPVGANLCVRPVFGQTHRSAPTFKPDEDGIIPVMDMDWFEDDAASRFEEFLGVAWPDPSPQPSPNSRPDGAASRGEGALLEENMKFVADSLSPKVGETPRDTIRRYLSTQFYKDHMQTYKKRPIYWLFSSGKQRAFECLVYLHRYNEATLSRMRNEYVTPLQGKFSARVEYLSNEVNAASSTSARTKLQKQLDALKKKQVELVAFDDLLRHYADKRIPLDLDDGVKVNYGKFGHLLAEVKAITGGVEE